MKYMSVSEMQAVELEANACGISYEEMMEHAGKNLAQVILDDYGFLEEKGAVGLTGSGNNGGDTLVALAYLAQQGWQATAVIARQRPEADPLVERLEHIGGQIINMSIGSNVLLLRKVLSNCGVVMDGLLGTGTRLPLKTELAEFLEQVRQVLNEISQPPVVIAVDCPSGVDCDSGEAAPECIPADQTVTMAAIKHGLFKFPAYALMGKIQVVDIGPPGSIESLNAWKNVKSFIPDSDWITQAFPERPLDAHKGTFGTALIVAGSTSYTGAAWLAGQAAYRIGAGLVTLAVPEPLHIALAGQFPEATWVLLPHEDGFVSRKAAGIVLNNLNRVTSMLVGPGFGMAETTQQFLDQLLGDAEIEKLPSMVIDADGLKLLSRLSHWEKRLPPLSILTPHPGEMSFLTSLSVEEIQKERLAAARTYSQDWGHVVVLKGAFTIVAEPGGRTAVIPIASPALARAGSGDVLAGLVAGLRAQQTPAFESAVCAAMIHGLAGLHAAETLGSTRSVLASDVLNAVMPVIAELGD